MVVVLTRLSPGYYLKTKTKFLRKIFLNLYFLFWFGASVPNYNRLNVWPRQFLRTGFYDLTGFIRIRTGNGDWWSGTASSATLGHYLASYVGEIFSQGRHFSGHGYALRGVVCR